jgi:APA family basic amino acid/polyamine antiporter
MPDTAHSLKRVLGAGDLIMLAIGAVIGAGIFSSIGTAAAGEVLPTGEVVRYGAGPALVFSFVLLGIVCGLAALCYAELAAMIPQAGSAYAYSYATLGEFVAWIIGWDRSSSTRSGTSPWRLRGAAISCRCSRASGSRSRPG